VILLQHGNALVGAWDSEVCGFSHPKNQRELAAEAMAAVLESYPNADIENHELRFFTCPESLIERFNWDWKKRPES
jgi:hypothetical protein